MSNVKIGWSKREISIDKPVSILGQMYIRVSEGILDPIYSTALCVEGKNGAVVFCTIEVAALDGEVIKGVENNLKTLCPDLPHNCIIFSATHTHSSMSTGNTPEKTPDGVSIYSGLKCREYVIKMTSEAIEEAWKNRKSGGIAYGYGYAVVAHSRRVTYTESRDGGLGQSAPNGHAVMYGATNRPIFAGYEAGADHFLNAVYTFDENKKLTGIVCNVPCPSQLSEHFTKLSSDYWHETRELVKEEFGEDVFLLPQCAAAGDLSPRLMHYREAQARRFKLKYGVPDTVEELCDSHNYNRIMCERHDIAERIVSGLKEIYLWAKNDIKENLPVYCVRRELSLTRRQVTENDVEWCKKNIEYMDNHVPNPDDMTSEEYRKKKSEYDSIRKRFFAGIEKAEKLKTDPTYETVAYYARLGDIGFASTRFELYMDYMHRIQARSPFKQTFLLELSGESGCTYLPTKRATENKGYSASIFCNFVGPEGGQEYVEETLKNLNELAEKS